MNNVRRSDYRTLIGDLFKLERRGRHEEALDELKAIWENFDEFPNVEHLEPHDAAEILLRCGAIVGFHGHNKQINDAQEHSLNVLTDARRRFIALDDTAKIAECENYLALAYARKANYSEAFAWIDESLSHKIPDTSNVRISSQLTKGLILMMTRQYGEVLEYLLPLQKLFVESGDAYLRGSFCTNVAVAMQSLGRPQEARVFLESARRHHRESGHLIYLGTIENNLSNIYSRSGDFQKAIETIDSAISIFETANDQVRIGFAFDTKAQIFLRDGKYVEALKEVERALDILLPLNFASFLVETLMTKVSIMLRLEGSTSAFLCLTSAVEIARTQIGEDHARKLIEDYERELEVVEAERRVEPPSESVETLELELPPSIAFYSNYSGIWIRNDHLEKYGVRKGSLAVVVSGDLKRGDIAAISEKTTGDVYCGIYDLDFGIVCMEGIGGEPILFNQDEIEILGKIVGFGDPSKQVGGRVLVSPLKRDSSK